ncbi:MAG: hypothetical protein ACTSRN_01225 [Alphaproteobacteria bacterium]
MASNKGFSLKDQLFNEGKVRYLGELFHTADPTFDADTFVSTVMETMLELELKARINLIAEVLERFLPTDFEVAAARIHAALPPELDPNKTDDDFGEFIIAPLGEYVVQNGLEDLTTSLPLLKEITKRFSMEFALRHFLIAAPNETMAALTGWAKDDNYHVRRLVSEGTRPTLPWGIKVDLEARDTLALLQVLHGDGARFVTRSVANHLNDISKKQPGLVVDTLSAWADQGTQNVAELDWMTRHALRTLIKKGDVGALTLLGYRENPKIEVSRITIDTPILKIGEVAMFNISIKAARDENLMIDYVIDFVKANGRTAPKVFKLKKLKLKAGQSVDLLKKHRFLKNSTTFKHYAGAHCLYLQVNGQRHGACEFDLLD